MSNSKYRRDGRRWFGTAVVILTMLLVLLYTGRSGAQNERFTAQIEGTPSPGAGLNGSGSDPWNAPLALQDYIIPTPCEKHYAGEIFSAPCAVTDVSTGTAGETGACSVDIMPLGDSITLGYDGNPVTGIETGYRRELYQSLIDDGYDVDFVGNLCHLNHGKGWDNTWTPVSDFEPDFDPDHEGHPAVSTYFIKNNVIEFLKDNPPDIVLLHIGTNDLKTENPNNIIGRIKQILDNIYETDPDTMVILAKVMLRRDNDDRKANSEILNRLIQQLDQEYDTKVLKFVDMASAVKYPAHYSTDKFHPNETGYIKIYEFWDAALKKYLPIYCGFPGGEWVEMGNVSDTYWASEPALALGPNGTPFIAWLDYSGGDHEIYVKEWNNSDWVDKGSGSAAGGGISNTSDDSIHVDLTVDTAGSPIVAWEERKASSSEIYVKRWNAQDKKWEQMAGSVSSDGSSDSGHFFAGAATRPSLAYGPDGPIVAWHNYFREGSAQNPGKSGYQIYVKQWDGDSWEEMSDGSASGKGISRSDKDAFTPSVAVRDGEVLIAWADTGSGNGEIYVKRWNAQDKKWEQMAGSASGGGISKTTGNSFRASLILDFYGRPIVAWEDNNNGNYEIYLKRWNDNSWVEMNGSAHKGGISNTTAHSNWPSLAIDVVDGLPVVAWQEVGTYGNKVYGKRWYGDSWEEIGGSAVGGGISDCEVYASKPSLAADTLGAPIVAWDCGMAGTYNIYVRRWQPAGPPVPPPPTPTPPSTGAPKLTINHNSGAPGSFFTVSGSGFPTREEVTVKANGRELSSVAVGGDGAFDFVLATTGADEGYYAVTASVNPSATVHFELAASAPTRPKDSTAPVIEVPAGIALTERYFLPLSMR